MKATARLVSNLAAGAKASRTSLGRLVCFGAVLLVACPARATLHTWKISEIYSSADGSVQFIKLHESLGFNGENLLATHVIRCNSGSLSNTLIFPANLPSATTANKTFIIGTANLAAVPGGVTPDYVFTNPVPFLFRSGGTINYAGFDVVNYTALPSDGVASLVRSGTAMVFSPTNSPANFGGVSNSIVPVRFASAVRSGTNFVLTFATATGPNGAAGPVYEVQTNGAVGSTSWATFTNVTGNGAAKSVAIPINAPQRIFRLQVP